MDDLKMISIIRSTRIFLNIFGLTLQEGVVKRLEIYDINNNTIGEAYLNDDDKMIINAKVNNGTLSAEVVDFFEAVGKISNKVKFELVYDEQSDIKGVIDFIAYKYNDRPLCTCRANMRCRLPSGLVSHITMNPSDIFFDAKIQSNDCADKVYMRFYGPTGRELSHRLEKGEYDKDLFAYPHCKVVTLVDDGFDANLIDVTVLEQKIQDGKRVQLADIHEKIVKPDIRNMDKKTIVSQQMIQKGKVMHEYDSSLNEYFNQLNSIFMVGDTSLFRNLVSTCYDSFSDEIIDAIFGIERNRTFYQNGARRLRDSYYEIENDSFKGKSTHEGE